MIYGPDDKPILRTPLEAAVYNISRRKLEMLQKKFQFTDYWGPTLYDARGNRIEWPSSPRLPIRGGKPIRFYRRDPVSEEAAKALGYREGETKNIPLPE